MRRPIEGPVIFQPPGSISDSCRIIRKRGHIHVTAAALITMPTTSKPKSFLGDDLTDSLYSFRRMTVKKICFQNSFRHCARKVLSCPRLYFLLSRGEWNRARRAMQNRSPNVLGNDSMSRVSSSSFFFILHEVACYSLS